jgi:hypothetical protein
MRAAIGAAVRFSGGLAGPRESIGGCLRRLYLTLAACGVGNHRHVSGTVVVAAFPGRTAAGSSGRVQTPST